MKIFLLTVLVALPFIVCAQSTSSVPEEFSEAIEDNSFLIEEAFNQEERVVQHISTLIHFSSPQKEIGYSFTQEWPAWSHQHQLSITVPYSSLGGGAVSGLGDILLNYRYQAMDAEDEAAFSPRFSVILPTGDPAKGLGTDVVGFQINLPVSKRFTDAFIAHINAGVTVLPGVKGVDVNLMSVRRSLVSYNLGGSIIFLIAPAFNVLVEGGTNFLSDMDMGTVVHSTESFINPGVRFAIDAGNLQIVPGIGVPTFFSGGASRTGVFGYLSFEHPF